MTTAQGTALGFADVSVNYGATRALSGVTFDVQPGRIHALLGGNGSGKSTLIKVLAGVVRAQPGGVIVRSTTAGTVRHATDAMSPAISRDLGLRFVHQDLPLFPELSIAENLAIGSGFVLGAGGKISWRRQHERAAQVLERFGIAASPRDPASRLHPAARTMLAIVRALQDQLAPEDSVLVLDEPTAALPRGDVSWLLQSLRSLADQGQTILWVSHRLDEVRDAADDVTVLRDGKHQTTVPMEGRTTADLAELIVGRAVARQARAGTLAASPVVLEVKGLTAGAARDVDLTVRAGEILGLVGITGSGRSSILRAVYGHLARESGLVRVGGQELRNGHVPSARARGVRFLPEERSQIGFRDMSVAINASSPDVAKFWHGVLDRKAERREGEALIEQLGVRASSADAALDSLSGGNQQKVLIGAAIRSDPEVLLVDEPTQGVDVGARSDIHGLIKKAIEKKGCAIVVSSDLEEVVDLCHRVLVLVRGRVVAEIGGLDITERTIARHLDDESDGLTTNSPTELLTPIGGVL